MNIDGSAGTTDYGIEGDLERAASCATTSPTSPMRCPGWNGRR